MRTLSQADCLALWESGRSLHPLDKGLLAVHAAFPEVRGEGVADWPLGLRNRALAELYCACFGSSLHGWSACPQCAEKLEFQVDGQALMASHTPDSGRSISIDGRSFRLPTSRDLARVAREGDPLRAATCLLDVCVQADRAREIDPSQSAEHEWTEEEMEAIERSMAQADPLAEILLQFDCPSCGESFEESLDLPTFFWAELEGSAKRLLLDVHTLASAYGWGESEILALGPARRDFYLELVRA